MLTVTLEFRTDDLVAIGVLPSRLFPKYESVELLETLRLERGWRLQLVKVRRRGPLRSDEELERESRQIRREYGLQSFEVVERRPRTREYVLLLRQKNPPAVERFLALAGGSITPTAPFRVDPERTIASFHGDGTALRRVLARLERDGLPYKVLRSTSRAYAGEESERELTDRQKAAVARAWALGYYAVPRRINLTRLSSITGQSPPALGKMLRRAEGTLVTRFLSEQALEDEAASEAAEPPSS